MNHEGGSRTLPRNLMKNEALGQIQTMSTFRSRRVVRLKKIVTLLIDKYPREP